MNDLCARHKSCRTECVSRLRPPVQRRAVELGPQRPFEAQYRLVRAFPITEIGARAHLLAVEALPVPSAKWGRATLAVHAWFDQSKVIHSRRLPPPRAQTSRRGHLPGRDDLRHDAHPVVGPDHPDPLDRRAACPRGSRGHPVLRRLGADDSAETLDGPGATDRDRGRSLHRRGCRPNHRGRAAAPRRRADCLLTSPLRPRIGPASCRALRSGRPRWPTTSPTSPVSST